MPSRSDTTISTGSYYSSELDVTYRIFGQDGKPMMAIPPGRDGEIRRLGEDRFVAPAFSITIDRRDGEVAGFTVDAGRVRGIYFERARGSS